MWAKHQRMCSSFIATLQHNKAQLEFINLLVALLLFLWCTACTGAPRTQNQRQCHMCVHKHNMQQRSQTEQRQKSFQRHSNYNARMIGDKKVGSKCHTHIHAQWQLSRSVSCPPCSYYLLSSTCCKVTYWQGSFKHSSVHTALLGLALKFLSGPAILVSVHTGARVLLCFQSLASCHHPPHPC